MKKHNSMRQRLRNRKKLHISPALKGVPTKQGNYRKEYFNSEPKSNDVEVTLWEKDDGTRFGVTFVFPKKPHRIDMLEFLQNDIQNGVASILRNRSSSDNTQDLFIVYHKIMMVIAVNALEHSSYTIKEIRNDLMIAAMLYNEFDLHSRKSTEADSAMLMCAAIDIAVKTIVKFALFTQKDINNYFETIESAL